MVNANGLDVNEIFKILTHIWKVEIILIWLAGIAIWFMKLNSVIFAEFVTRHNFLLNAFSYLTRVAITNNPCPQKNIYMRGNKNMLIRFLTKKWTFFLS